MKKMCKKVVSLLLAAVMVLTMTAFASVVYAADEDSVEADPNFKMGVILVGDETEGYSAAHIAGVKEAAAELGLDESQIIWKYKVPEDSSCYDPGNWILKNCQSPHLSQYAGKPLLPVALLLSRMESGDTEYPLPVS